jgi:hypothetical protein
MRDNSLRGAARRVRRVTTLAESSDVISNALYCRCFSQTLVHDANTVFHHAVSFIHAIVYVSIED